MPHLLLTCSYIASTQEIILLMKNSMVMSTGIEDKEVPYGLIFSHSRRFNAFHVCFQDIVRGGMRLVTPPNPGQFILESARHYDE